MDRGAGGLQSTGSQRVGHDRAAKHVEAQMQPCPKALFSPHPSQHLGLTFLIISVLTGVRSQHLWFRFAWM